MLLVAELAGEGVLGADGVDVVLELGPGPRVHLVRGGHALVRVPAGAPLLQQREVPLEQRRYLVQKLDKRVGEEGRRGGLGVELLLGAVVDEEAAGGGGDVVVLVLRGDDLQVEQVAVQLPVAGRRVPARGGQHLEAGQLGGLLLGGGVQRQHGQVPRPGQDALGRRAVDRLGPRPLLLHDVARADGGQEAERGAVHAVVRVARLDGLEEVAHVAHVDPGLAHGVGLLHHLDQTPLLQPLDGLELCEVVERGAVQLQGEAGAVAGVLAVHQ